MAENKKYIGNGQLKGNPNQKLSLIIKDGAVDTAKLGDKAVTSEKIGDGQVKAANIENNSVAWNKLNGDLQNIIVSHEEHGVALSGDLGNETLIGITQKKITEELRNLQDQIDEIVFEKATTSFTLSVSAIFVGEESTIILNASTNTPATSIIIKRNDAELRTGSGTGLSVTDTVTPNINGVISYSADFTIRNNEKIISKNVNAVYPIYYGSGSIYTDVIDPSKRASARTTPKGTYEFTIENDSDYIFFVVPSDMGNVEAMMGGFEFPLEPPVDVNVTTETFSNIHYKVYKSSNTYVQVDATIIIS